MAQLESHPRSRHQKRFERPRWRVEVITGFLPVRVQQKQSDGLMMPIWLKSPAVLENVKERAAYMPDAAWAVWGKLGLQSGYGMSAQEVFNNSAIVVGDDVGL